MDVCRSISNSSCKLARDLKPMCNGLRFVCDMLEAAACRMYGEYQVREPIFVEVRDSKTAPDEELSTGDPDLT